METKFVVQDRSYQHLVKNGAALMSMTKNNADANTNTDRRQVLVTTKNSGQNKHNCECNGTDHSDQWLKSNPKNVTQIHKNW